MLNTPLIVLSLVIATAYGALFHLLQGRTLRQLLVYWSASIVGFGCSQLLASALSWNDPLIGELHVVPASLGAWLLMFFAKRLES